MFEPFLVVSLRRLHRFLTLFSAELPSKKKCWVCSFADAVLLSSVSQIFSSLFSNFLFMSSLKFSSPRRGTCGTSSGLWFGLSTKLIQSQYCSCHPIDHPRHLLPLVVHLVLRPIGFLQAFLSFVVSSFLNYVLQCVHDLHCSI